jgi:histidyl-tRNA synthetase
MQHQIPKGTFDILPYGAEEPWLLSHHWQYLESIIRTLAAQYGYREIRTPIYELTGLFDRGVGETSDIVSKEMFTFQDKGGRSITLRPEGTSSVVRALIENRLANPGSVHKFYYIGPMFRYERPQSGRYRQHHQFGVEAIGNASPEQDAEIIDLCCQFYKRLGIKNLKVHINTVGDPASRLKYRSALVDYLKPYLGELSPESQIRLEKNPLRILDSKDPKDKQLLQGAPSILNHLTDEARQHFQEVRHLLDQIQIPYAIDDKIVRGLDYYNKTVFEVLTENLGAQNTIGAGGRFDGLIATFGGPDLPAVGFATGLERVLQVLSSQKIDLPPSKHPLVYFIPMGQDRKMRETCFSLATLCRREQISADIELNAKKIQTALQNATRIEADYCIVIGTDEIEKGFVQLKNLRTRDQREVPLDRLLSVLKELSNG